MLKIRLLQAVCTVAMLGAVPAFAQSNTPEAKTEGAAAAPAAHQAMPDQTNGSSSGGSMASSNKDGLGVSSHGPKAHRTAMMHHNRAMHASSKTDSSQDSKIDQLNNQSYQAAQQGQTFSGNGSGDASAGMSSGMSKTGGSGSMNNMSGSGSGMSHGGSASNTMSSGNAMSGGNNMSGGGSANGGGSSGGAAGGGAAGGGAGGGSK
ncbi:MAG TPA: hypothetical protein VH023_09190 [Rhodopila sp.]|nr:hypothetical protein [Rhodopila sp.]